MPENAKIGLLIGMSVPLTILVVIGAMQDNFAVIASSAGGLVALLPILLSNSTRRDGCCGRRGATRGDEFVPVQGS